MSLGRILVTGADGFIGSHLTEHLVRSGYDVRAFTLYNSFGSWGWLDHVGSDVRGAFEVFAGDIRDPGLVHAAMRGSDTVLHLAALIAIPFSYQAPNSYVDTNIKGTLNVLQAARDLDVSKVVHTSTSEVYGTAQFVPIPEDHPVIGQSPYSATKIGADQLALSYFLSFETPLAIIRPFNTYGPRQSARAVIPSIITQVLDGADQVRLGSLHPTRDFSYVVDTVKGFIAVAESDRSVGQILNVGSSFEISIGDTAQVIMEAVGREVEVVCDKERTRPENSEVERLWADTTKVREMAGWSPSFSGLEGFRRGISETVAWFDSAENRESYKSGVYNL